MNSFEYMDALLTLIFVNITGVPRHTTHYDKYVYVNPLKNLDGNPRDLNMSAYTITIGRKKVNLLVDFRSTRARYKYQLNITYHHIDERGKPHKWQEYYDYDEIMDWLKIHNIAATKTNSDIMCFIFYSLIKKGWFTGVKTNQLKTFIDLVGVQ